MNRIRQLTGRVLGLIGYPSMTVSESFFDTLIPSELIKFSNRFSVGSSNCFYRQSL